MPLDESIQLNYALRSPIHKVEKPYQTVSQFAGEYSKTNITYSPAPEEVIHDIRGQEQQFGLDTHGFQVVQCKATVPDWMDKPVVEEQFLPDVRQFMLDEIEGADEVYIFNWRKRKNKPYREEGIQKVDLYDSNHYVLPADYVHIDYSRASSLRLVLQHMGPRAGQLLQGRVRIINLWKPISPHPIQDAPLALCDGSSVTDADFLTSDQVRHRDINEALVLVHRGPESPGGGGYNWHYLSQQTEQEAFFIKVFDSAGDEVPAKHCPHTSFKHRKIPAGCPPRESIEVRALVFTYPR